MTAFQAPNSDSCVGQALALMLGFLWLPPLTFGRSVVVSKSYPLKQYVRVSVKWGN
jgi:hypothetical protein